MYNILRTKTILAGNEVLGHGLRRPGFLRQPVSRLGLVAEFLLNGDANDTSETANNGTPTSIDRSDNDQGYNAKKATYNASGDMVTIANSSTYNVSTGTFSMWVKTTAASYVYLTCKNDNSAPNDNRLIGLGVTSGNGKVSFYNAAWRQGNLAVNDGVRHHIVLRATSGSTDIIIDGKLDANLAYNCFIATGAGGSLYIGNRFADNRNFGGDIQLFRMYNRLLTEREVRALYLEGLALLD